jgi:small subunit ribosomal protein S20
MPQHKSCEKRMKTSKKQNVYNRAVKSSVKTATKKFLVAQGEDAEAAYRNVASELDRAAKKGVIPRQRADRKKSRLAKAMNKANAASPA